MEYLMPGMELKGYRSQYVKVKVLEVDITRNRIQLSMAGVEK